MSREAVSDSGFILHGRPYRETSQIFDLFTEQHGRISAVGRGQRGGRARGALQPFMLLALSWSGARELKNLRHGELIGSHWYEGATVVAALYANELLLRMLPRDDPAPRLFQEYRVLLDGLSQSGVETALRRFERSLIDELGYGVSFEVDGRTHLPIAANGRYSLVTDEGFVADERGEFSGREVLDVGSGAQFDGPVPPVAKRIMRRLLAPHLDDRPLVSRSLLPRRRR